MRAPRRQPIGLGPTEIDIGAIPVDPNQDPDSAAEFMIGPPGVSMVEGAEITESSDGGVVVDFEPASANVDDPSALAFDANLGEYLLEQEKTTLVSDLIEAVEKDKDSRKEWENTYLAGMKLLGLRIEDRVYPFRGASGVFDPLLTEALLRTQSTLRGEMLPAAGPVKTRTVGEETQGLIDQAVRVQTWMNYYLTKGSPEYYEDYDQMLMWVIMVGSMFKKVYMDPQENRPVSPWIAPNDFIVNWTASSLYKCPRATHVIPMTQRDMAWAKMTKFYSDVSLEVPDEKSETNTTEQAVGELEGRAKSMADRGDDRYMVWEIHTNLDLPGFQHKGPDGKETGFPLPYVVAVESKSRKLLSIRRNWREGDAMYKPRMRFVHYKFFPGFGFYGYGLAHFLSGSAKAATSILRMLIDAGTLANFPGGLRVKGMRVDSTDNPIGPSEFREIDTGGLAINQAITTNVYKEPSLVLKDLRTELVESARRLASTTDIAVGDGRQDAPVGTTIALLEAAMKVESGVLKRMYEAQSHELGMYADLFGEFLPDDPYPFKVPGGTAMIMRKDFSESVDVIPVSDPNATSRSQRMMRSSELLKLGTAYPQIMQIKKIIRDSLQSWEIPDPDSYFVQPQQSISADPATENQVALQGGGIRVAPYQDDDSHVQAHMEFLQVPNMQAHIAEHLASKYRKLVEQVLGQPLPPLGQQMPPEIENQIAFMVAQATDAIKMDMPEGPNPLQVKMDEIKVKAMDVQRKAAEAQAKIDLEGRKAYMDLIKSSQADATKLKAAKISAIAAMADNERPVPERTVNIVGSL